MRVMHVASRRLKPVRGYWSTTFEETPVVVTALRGASKKVNGKRKREMSLCTVWLKFSLHRMLNQLELVVGYPLGVTLAVVMPSIRRATGS